jgi:hypothetical protein
VAYTSIGVYDYKIVATDSLTGLVNQADVFQIAITPPTIATDLVIVVGSEISDLNYLVSEPAVLLSVPSYTFVPADADVWLDYTLGASTPSFVTVVQPTPGVFKV